MVSTAPDPEDLADAFFTVAHGLKRTVNARVQREYPLASQLGLAVKEFGRERDQPASATSAAAFSPAHSMSPETSTRACRWRACGCCSS